MKAAPEAQRRLLDLQAVDTALAQLAQAVEGAKKAKTEPVPGTGDEATLVRYDLKKKEGVFKQQTVVTRVENVVLTLDYNGAGLAGDKTPDADGLEKPVAYVVLAAGAQVDETELVEYCRAGLPSFKRPRRVIFVDSYPTTATGKIRRVELRAQAAGVLS